MAVAAKEKLRVAATRAAAKPGVKSGVKSGPDRGTPAEDPFGDDLPFWEADDEDPPSERQTELFESGPETQSKGAGAPAKSKAQPEATTVVRAAPLVDEAGLADAVAARLAEEMPERIAGELLRILRLERARRGHAAAVADRWAWLQRDWVRRAGLWVLLYLAGALSVVGLFLVRGGLG